MGDVPCSRRMPRQVREHGATLIDPGVGIALADYRLFAGLVQAFDKNELPAMVGLAKSYPGPPGEHIGKVRHVLLRITGADAERVQRSEEHTSELQSLRHLVCRLLLEKKKNKKK